MSPKVHSLLSRTVTRLNAGYCTGAYARTEHGRAVGWAAPHAHTFCALGALYREAENEQQETLTAAFDHMLTLVVDECAPSPVDAITIAFDSAPQDFIKHLEQSLAEQGAKP